MTIMIRIILSFARNFDHIPCDYQSKPNPHMIRASLLSTGHADRLSIRRPGRKLFLQHVRVVQVVLPAVLWALVAGAVIVDLHVDAATLLRGGGTTLRLSWPILPTIPMFSGTLSLALAHLWFSIVSLISLCPYASIPIGHLGF